MKWPLKQFENKDVVFIGRGREGLSFEKFINEQAVARSFRFVAQEDDPDYLEKLKSLNLDQTIIVKTAGCPGRIVAVPYTTPTNVFMELALGSGATIAGITGTKGKSTTASLAHHILKCDGKNSVLAGNIGKPMIDCLNLAKPGTIFILELGAYQTAELKFSPHYSLIINLFREHLDYFGSETAYYEAKHQLIANMRPEDTYIYNPQTPLLAEWAKSAKGRTVAIDWDALESVDITKTQLIGEHNRRNIVAAQTLAGLLGADKPATLSAPYSFEPLKHRLQILARKNDRLYVDDAISTTPESAIAALESIDNIGCMLLGGQDRGYDFTALAQKIADLRIPALVFFPDSGQRIKAAMPHDYKPACLDTSDMSEAVQFAATNAPVGSAVLLSTASPSYGLWKDFEAKGDEFQSAVNALPLDSQP